LLQFRREETGPACAGFEADGEEDQDAPFPAGKDKECRHPLREILSVDHDDCQRLPPLQISSQGNKTVAQTLTLLLLLIQPYGLFISPQYELAIHGYYYHLKQPRFEEMTSGEK
jgi:hypothetical protein